MKNFFEQLSQTELFSGIPSEYIAKMLDCMNANIRKFSKGEFLMRAGETPVSIGLVISGEVHIVKEDFWGNNFILTDVSRDTPLRKPPLFQVKKLFFSAPLQKNKRKRFSFRY